MPAPEMASPERGSGLCSARPHQATLENVLGLPGLFKDKEPEEVRERQPTGGSEWCPEQAPLTGNVRDLMESQEPGQPSWRPQEVTVSPFKPSCVRQVGWHD